MQKVLNTVLLLSLGNAIPGVKDAIESIFKV